MKFFNREMEVNKILSIIEGEPNFIYFIFGPINSGKTALINEVINNRLDDNYKVFYINFRRYLISEKREFIEAIFTTKKEGVLEEIKNKSEVINLLIKGAKVLSGIPIPEVEFNKLFEERINDVFQYLNDILLETKNSGKKPILIFDELQMIRDVVLNGQKYLLKELFQFLVSLTKEQHLCHVFCLSSDSLFIEYIYNAGELEERADYILIDDFDRETALRFMDFLAKEILDKNLSDEEKEKIFSYVGGKPVSIYKAIDKMRYERLEDILNEMLKIESSKLKKLLIKIKNGKYEGIDYDKVINALLLFKKEYVVDEYKLDEDTKEFLVKMNVLFLNPIEETIRPQSYLLWNAIKRVL